MTKKKKYLLTSIVVILFISAFLVSKNFNVNNSERLLQNIIDNGSGNFLEDSLVELPTKNNTSLYLLSDSYGFIHFIMSDKEQILLNSKLLTRDEKIKDVDLVWLNKHINKHMKYALYGIIYNDDIETLSVNNSEVTVINYLDHRVFFSANKFEVPVLIEGYTKSGELIYKNSQ